MAREESNLRHAAFQTTALPAELRTSSRRRTRTFNILRVGQVLSQLSYAAKRRERESNPRAPEELRISSALPIPAGGPLRRGPGRNRTDYSLFAKQGRYLSDQARVSRGAKVSSPAGPVLEASLHAGARPMIFGGSGGWIRTSDPRIMGPVGTTELPYAAMCPRSKPKGFYSPKEVSPSYAPDYLSLR